MGTGQSILHDESDESSESDQSQSQERSVSRRTQDSASTLADRKQDQQEWCLLSLSCQWW